MPVNGPDGVPVPYAARAQARWVADTHYLNLVGAVGHDDAAARTCARHGHDVRGGRCDRCGRGVSGSEQRALRESASRLP